MSILSDLEIIEAVKKGDIYISDFDPKREYDGSGKYNGKLGPNGYDLTLNKKLLVYNQFPLDMKIDNPIEEIIIPPEGLVLQPGIIYLGKTNEYTMTNNYVPFLESRSSLARLGMGCHYFSGYGDVGFQGYWTLEITVIHPTRVYADTSVCQISYNTVEGEVGKKYNGKYQGSKDVLSSMIYKDEIFDNNIDDKKEENTISFEYRGFPCISDSVTKKAEETIEHLSALIDNENVPEINENPDDNNIDNILYDLRKDCINSLSKDADDKIIRDLCKCPEKEKITDNNINLDIIKIKEERKPTI